MQRKRIDNILEIIKENGFVTVKYLCDELHYSTATINRDLNELQKQGLIVRNHGGAESVNRKYAPLIFRYQKNKQIKSRLAHEASSLISDGMTIFIDGSTTAQLLGKYIIDHKNIKVITNNVNLASFLSEAGTSVVCLGGEIVEAPHITGGTDAAIHAESYTADIGFFSTSSLTSDGKINCGNHFFRLFNAIINNSKKVVFMADSSKIDYGASRILCDFSRISTIVTDYKFSDDVKNNFPNTEFIEVDAKSEQ